MTADDAPPDSGDRRDGSGRSSGSPDTGAEGEAGGPDPGFPPGGSGESRGVCELCGGPTVERHCKIVCLNCGYKRDCSDP